MDEAKLEQFMGQAVADLGAAISGLMVYLGDARPAPAIAL